MKKEGSIVRMIRSCIGKWLRLLFCTEVWGGGPMVTRGFKDGLTSFDRRTAATLFVAYSQVYELIFKPMQQE